MDKHDVLIVEDDLSLSEALADTLELAGFSVITAGDGQQALQNLAHNTVRLVISDVQMRNMDGLTLLEQLQSHHPELPVLLMTAYGTIEKAVQAMQAGAANYLVKPFAADELVRQARSYLGPKPQESDERVVEDEAMKKVMGLASRVAKCEATVLIQGESGVGKEVLARYIHQNSPRHQGSFVAINCAAIPDNMLEAELFGYEKGAFTGAVQTVPGRFELAQGGTLLLDEISEMALPMQAKLLRVLQERELERVGGRKTIHLDVRVLATTNRNLKQMADRGMFREDLFYRLSVFPLTIPPLRERRADILPLAKSLLKRHWKSGKAAPDISNGAAVLLQNYAWPGNVRELDNVIQRALIMLSGLQIQPCDLMFETAPLMSTCDDRTSITRIDETQETLGAGRRSAEEKIILDTLIEEKGSRKSAADRLGISQRTLRYKIARMKEAGLAVPS
jgi:two-component system response regulator FlrC